MGFLDNSSVTIDAILTKKGRELLSKGSADFKITQFALADDEIDYTLWNPDHPNGSDYYGAVIQSMPLLEAFPDETQSMRYKLITLPRSTTRIPVLTLPISQITLNGLNTISDVTPQVANITGANATLGYTAIIADNSLCSISLVPGSPVVNSNVTVPRFIGDSEAAQSVSVIGFNFRITCVFNNTTGTSKVTTLTIIGNETGGQITIPITIPSIS
jgi:hypothetical protein